MSGIPPPLVIEEITAITNFLLDQETQPHSLPFYGLDQQLSTDLSKGSILGGTSAGANFTAGIAHLAAQDNLPSKLTGLLFLAGSFCHPDARPEKSRDRILSVDEINDAPGLMRKSIDYFASESRFRKTLIQTTSE
ncbi:alpha/beta-hydrolase [Aspergillus affinis]|uniref:alpha/beta-hydrolase n=1 Tax=Aspergillus affinis TaxID=1070780 RepID=UPI0022FE4D0E|nr:alpha/beta-hydrolase [Aspergillus affinis]KAI9042503.1 alpha/beta-hydrolase [Aspergillus affinis]